MVSKLHPGAARLKSERFHMCIYILTLICLDFATSIVFSHGVCRTVGRTGASPGLSRPEYANADTGLWCTRRRKVRPRGTGDPGTIPTSFIDPFRFRTRRNEPDFGGPWNTPGRGGTYPPSTLGPDATWRALFDEVVGLTEVAQRPFVLVLDDVHRLREARSRYLEAALACQGEAVQSGHTLHVVLVGPESALPEDGDLPPESPGPLRIGPLPLRAARTLLPGVRPLDALLAYGVFGGVPSVLRRVDPRRDRGHQHPKGSSGPGRASG